jgi:hypothetical protein
MKRRVYFLGAAATAALLTLAAFAAVTMASPASGVTPTLLARGTYGPFKVKSDRKSPIEFKAKAKSGIDVVVRRHDYAVNSHTGWHSHPGPVFITVTQGTLTYYEWDDPNCTPHVVSADPAVSPTNAFVDDGSGHIVRNLSGAPAQDVSVIIAPVGGAFRTDPPEFNAGNPSCGF